MNISYSLGMLLADNLKNQGFNDIDANDLAAGVVDYLKNEPKIPMDVAFGIYESYTQGAGSKHFAEKLEEGRAFLEDNKKRSGVITTASGLQYEVIEAGTGTKPSATDSVLTHYHGTLLDGTVFDSSVRRGQPIEFGVNQVISGWTEALQLMGTGAKWRLFLPYQLAYGEQGAGGSIGPYETLIFEVELIAVNGKS